MLFDELSNMLLNGKGETTTMYEFRREDGQEFPFAILDECGNVVARVRVLQDAKEIVASWNLVERAIEDFPGLKGDVICDDDTIEPAEPVDGGDLVDLFNARLKFDGDRFEEN